MPLARASELDRVLECPGSLSLPRERFIPLYGSSADWGNRVHSWVETGEVPNDRMGEALRQRIAASKVDREALWPSAGEHELPLALNVHTREVRRCVIPDPLPPGYQSRRAYAEAWKAAFDLNWVVGTLDYGRELLDSYWVDDLKTGRNVHWKQYEAQQSFYCLAFSIFLYDGVRSGRSTLSHWPRYPIGAPLNRFGFFLESDYLTGFAKQLVVLYDRVARLKEKGEGYVTGEHCNYCPSQGWCPRI